VVSNERCVENPDGDVAGRWSFARTPLISPYITAVVAGPYASVHRTHDGIDLGLYVRKSLQSALDVDELFEVTAQGFDWFNANFGIRYPFGKYDQLFVPEFNAGAMENPGCVTFSESYLFRSKVTDAARERRAETILHEMAHMWFGDLVTMRWWDDLWLNESFASFSAVLSQTRATRYRHAWVTFLDSEKTWAKFQDQLPSTHPIAADMYDIETVHQNFDGITYAKGAAVLRQLVAWVGEDAFLAGCREYFRRHQWDNAELGDFLGALEESSGRDLSTWVAPWLQTTGVNTLGLQYEVTPDGTLADVVVTQTADPEHPTIRPHRIAIGVYDWQDTALARVERVEIDVEGEETAVPALEGVPAGAFLLPNDDDLTYAKLRLDSRSMDALTKDLAAITEPLPRALVWASAWDMTRDGDLAASRFVELVLGNVTTETQIGVLQRVLHRALGAAERYADPSHREALLAALCDQARAELQHAAPGSDIQLAWARQWMATARTPDRLGAVRALLDEVEQIEGLQMDAELRWHAVFCLARAGLDATNLIESESRRDPTDLGQRHAATARAAQPDERAKSEAWHALIDDASLSHTMSRQVWNGFQQLTQPDLIEPFVDRYFEALPVVWDQRSTEFAIEFAEGMFPHACASDDLLARTRAAADDDAVAKPLRRALSEQAHTLERTLAARAKDAAESEDGALPG
jgi:aminopeptidase N